MFLCERAWKSGGLVRSQAKTFASWGWARSFSGVFQSRASSASVSTAWTSLWQIWWTSTVGPWVPPFILGTR